MPARARLLFLSQSLPYPPHAGVAARTFHVLRALAGDFDIRLVAFFRRNHHPDAAARAQAVRALREIVADVAEPAPIGAEHSAGRKVWDHLRSVVTARAYTHYLYESRAFAERLQAAWADGAPDLVHLDSLDLHRYLPELPRAPVACTHHNVESHLLRLLARRLRPAALRPYVHLEARRLAALERAWSPRFAANVMTSDRDAERLRAIAPAARTVVVPNGVDTDYFRPASAPAVDGRVVFVGPTYSFPNRDAVEFLLAEIWPRVRALVPRASLRLIGRGAPSDLARYERAPGVGAPGWVADVRPEFAAAACAVVPIRIGGGTRLKILDAWAMGKAVVSTSVGCEGLAVEDGGNILVRDDPHEFAAAVAAVLRDGALRRRLEAGGRHTAVEDYAWPAIGRRIRSAYRAILDGAAAPPSPAGAPGPWAAGVALHA